jgi:hypothetical protein
MKTTLKILLAISALIFTASAFAATTLSANQGFYVGGDLGLGSTACSDCAISLRGTDSTSFNGVAGTLLAGYQVNSYLAFEVGYGMLPQLEYEGSLLPNAGKDSESVSTTHLYEAIKGIYALDKQWSLFGKVGYDSMWLDSGNVGVLPVNSFTASGVLLAIGGSYIINPEVALTASYNQILDSGTQSDATTENISVGYVTVGLTYLL